MKTKRHQVSLLKQILWEKRISQSQLSADTGISYVYLNRIINDWVIPSQKSQELICQYLDVEPDEIFNTKDRLEMKSKKEE